MWEPTSPASTRRRRYLCVLCSYFGWRILPSQQAVFFLHAAAIPPANAPTESSRPLLVTDGEAQGLQQVSKHHGGLGGRHSPRGQQAQQA